MSQGELEEHRRYLMDERRSAAYRAALAEVVGPTDVVLDLGSGTGVLGYFACEAGAESVIAVDRGDILGLARRVATENGYADRISHVQALSTELQLETLADVVVCDQIGGLVHDAGILQFFADVRRRLLVPGGRMVPASFRIFLAPVTFKVGREAVEFWSSKPSLIDVSAARSLAANTEWGFSLGPEDAQPLAPGRELASFAADHVNPITGTVQFEVSEPGRFDGFIGWFEAQLSPSVMVTSDPWSADRFDRWCNFYPVDEALDLVAGDRVRLDLDIRPRLELVSWSSQVVRHDGRTHRSRQSTFASSFLSTSTLDRFTVDQSVGRSDRIEWVRAVLDLIDGKRTQAEIVEALADEVPVNFASRAHLEGFVRKVVSLAP